MERMKQRIRDRIDELRLSEAQVAVKCGVSQQALNNFLRGGKKAPYFLVPLARTLKTSAEQLYYGDNAAAAAEVNRAGLRAIVEALETYRQDSGRQWTPEQYGRAVEAAYNWYAAQLDEGAEPNPANVIYIAQALP